MPTLSFTSSQTYDALCHWLSNKQKTHHRQILLIDSTLPDSLEILDIIVNSYACTHLVSDTLSTPKNCQPIKLKNYKNALGSETEVLIYDARNAINLDILYATSGMVCAGGLLVLYMENTDNSHLENGLKMSFACSSKGSIFMRYMQEHLTRTDVAKITSTEVYLPSSDASKQHQNIVIERKSKHKKNGNIVLSEEQQTIFDDYIKRYIKHATLHKSKQQDLSVDEQKSVVLILGERGRGKSTLVGIIAAAIARNLQANPDKEKQTLVFCAVNKQNTHVLEASFYQQLKTLPKAQNDISLRFYAPDAVTELAPKNAIVFIDEMSSIAPRLLKKIVATFEYVIMTGTSSGYEGSGKGLLLRLLPFLKSEYSSTVYSLNRPFRWLPNDPIESFFSKLIPQVAITNEQHSNEIAIPQKIEYKLLSKTALLNDANIYYQVFSLLNQAHYQSTPNDIVRLVDASDSKLLCAQTLIDGKITILGVCSLIIEGGDILRAFADDISLGKRRVQGHLTAQALSLYLLSPEFAIKKYIRINRIAVNDNYRRLGIGSELIKKSKAFGKSQHVDFISTSFGYEISLFTFWQKNQFKLVKLGERVDTASGTVSVIMLLDNGNNDGVFTALEERTKLDIAFFNLCKPKLYEIFQSLAITPHEQTRMQLCFLDSKINLFEKYELSFRNIAPFVLAKIHLIEDHEEQQHLLTLFNACFKKGIHKQKRIHLENSIIDNIC